MGALSDLMHPRVVECGSDRSFSGSTHREEAVSAADSLGFVLKSLPLACRWACKQARNAPSGRQVQALGQHSETLREYLPYHAAPNRETGRLSSLAARE